MAASKSQVSHVRYTNRILLISSLGRGTTLQHIARHIFHATFREIEINGADGICPIIIAEVFIGFELKGFTPKIFVAKILKVALFGDVLGGPALSFENQQDFPHFFVRENGGLADAIGIT